MIAFWDIITVVKFIIPLIYISVYYKVRTNSTENKNFRLIMSIGAFVVPVLILVISNLLYVILQGDKVSVPGTEGTKMMFENEEVTLIVFLIFQITLFALFIMYYDKKERGEIEWFMFLICLILFFISFFYLPTANEFSWFD